MMHEKISAYFGEIAVDPHHRYRSWEHCYGFLREARPSGLAAEQLNGALQLGIYLASWGMYRGSTFLLQRAYTVHVGARKDLATSVPNRAWDNGIPLLRNAKWRRGTPTVWCLKFANCLCSMALPVPIGAIPLPVCSQPSGVRGSGY